jgi:uncharacterized protein (DUF433 family)
MATVSLSVEHIAKTPDTCGGRPRIAGTRIRVQDVVFWHEQRGMPPEQIVADYPHLTLADVHAALAYYHDHRDEIQEGFLRDGQVYDALRAQQPSIFEKARA